MCPCSLIIISLHTEEGSIFIHLLVLFRTEGHKAYIIPAGGSSTMGVWGYIDGFDEMMKQVRVRT